MIAATDSVTLNSSFLALLPRIQLHAQIFFRKLKCPHVKDDLIAETVALAWHWYVRLASRGKDAAQFASTLASFAARAAICGRWLCGQEATKDVHSFSAQQRHHFELQDLQHHSPGMNNAWYDALADNTESPIPEQVSFRCDFPAWRNTRSGRDRRLIEDLMSGERATDVARKYGLSAARIAQLRREFHADWERYCGDSQELIESTSMASK